MSTFKKSWIFTFIFLIGFGCSQKGSNPNTGGEQLNKDLVYLSGMVNTSGAPKDGVLITATDINYIPGSSVSKVYSTQTNSDGYYALPLPIGVYNITAEGRGLQKAIRNMVRFSGTDENLNFILTATGDLTGRIAYRQGSVEGFVVFLYGTQFMAVTDQSGVYKMSGIPIGTYRMGVINTTEDTGDSDGGGGPFALNFAVVIEAGQTTDLGTKDGSEIDQFASIDYVNPQDIGQSRDINHPVVIHRHELFDDSYDGNPGIMVQFDRQMDSNSVIMGQTVLIEAPEAFATKNLTWRLDWGSYSYKDHMNNQTSVDRSRSQNSSRALITGASYEYGQPDENGLFFYPSACQLTITPRTAAGLLAENDLPVGKYVVRIKNTVKDACGNPLYREYVYTFELREMMRWTVVRDVHNDIDGDNADGDDNYYFLPDGATGIDVGECVAAQFSCAVDPATVDFETGVIITPDLPGKKVSWRDNSTIFIHGLYAEDTTYAIELAAGIKSVNGDPIAYVASYPYHIDPIDPVSGKFTIHFTTAAPKVAAMFPANNSLENCIYSPVSLVFNTITDRDTIQSRIHIYDDTAGVENAVEIPAWQGDDSPQPSYRLAWVYADSSYTSPTSGNNNNSDCGDEECAGCCQNVGDYLNISFPRQYGHIYRVKLDAGSLSYTGEEIPAFSGTFKTKVPRLVESDPEDRETFVKKSDGLWFRFNVNLDSSCAEFTLTTNNLDIPTIPVDLQFYGGTEISLIPKSLPYSTAFTLTMSNLKADDGSAIPDQVIHFTTDGLKIVGSYPEQGMVNYDLNPDGSDDVVTINFNGHLTDEMKSVVEDSIDIIGSYYLPDVDPSASHPNYPLPMFFWTGWGYGWSRLQIAFTMDPCTNYKVHMNTDPATKALFYDDDQDQGAPDATPDVPFLWVDKDLVFTTMCQGEEWENPQPELLYATMPEDGTTEVNLDSEWFYLYFTPPNIQSGLDLEITAIDKLGEETLLDGSNDYAVIYPNYYYNAYNTVINFRIFQLQPSTTYRVKVKGVDIPSGYSDPVHNNLSPDPYVFSFTTEPATIEVSADNERGMLTFTANSGGFKISDFEDPATFTLKPDLRADVFEWKFYKVNFNDEWDEMGEEATGDYANRAVLHYKPAQYALIEVKAPAAIDRWIPDPTWTPGPGETTDDAPAVLSGQFANTPGKWIFNVSPDITLPVLERVEQAKDGHYDYIRLYFNIAVDGETALNPDNYSISYTDESNVTHTLEVEKALDYGCLQYNGWNPDACNPDAEPPAPEYDPPAVLEPDGQLVLKTAPQDLVEYTLTVTGVKSATQRYTISGNRGIATFQGHKYPGRVTGSAIVETADDIRAVYDSPDDPSSWGVRVNKVAIQFDKPMDTNITVALVQPGVTSGADIVITAGDDYHLLPTCFDPVWYSSDAGSDTVLVVHCKYEVDSGSTNYPPENYTIRVTDKCRNAVGQPLENTLNEYRQVSRYTLFPSATAWLDESAPYEPSGPAVIRLDYSSITGISQEAVGYLSSYRLVDPALMNEESSAILDSAGAPVTVEIIDFTDWPSQCTLILSGYPDPALNITDPLLVYSDIPAPSLPSWFPIEALKDVGYSHLTGLSGTL